VIPFGLPVLLFSRPDISTLLPPTQLLFVSSYPVILPLLVIFLFEKFSFLHYAVDVYYVSTCSAVIYVFANRLVKEHVMSNVYLDANT